MKKLILFCSVLFPIIFSGCDFPIEKQADTPTASQQKNQQVDSKQQGDKIEPPIDIKYSGVLTKESEKLIEQDRIEEAVRLLGKAVMLNPNNAKAKQYLVLIRKGELPTPSPIASLGVNQGNSLQVDPQLQDPDMNAAEAISEEENESVTQLASAVFTGQAEDYIRQDRLQEASSVLLKALELDPGNTTAKSYLMQLRNGDKPKVPPMPVLETIPEELSAKSKANKDTQKKTKTKKKTTKEKKTKPKSTAKAKNKKNQPEATPEMTPVVEEKKNLIGDEFVLNILAPPSKQEQNQQEATDEEKARRKALKNIADDDPFLGEVNAPLIVVVFLDYEDPAYKKFSQEVLPKIKERYIATGKVRFVFRDRPQTTNPHAFKAAVAANCVLESAGNTGYVEFHNLLLSHQNKLTKDAFMEYAAVIRLNSNDFLKCFNKGSGTEIIDDIDASKALGITGAPALLVGDTVLDETLDFSNIQKEIEQQLAAVSAT